MSDERPKPKSIQQMLRETADAIDKGAVAVLDLIVKYDDDGPIAEMKWHHEREKGALRAWNKAQRAVPS